MIWKDVSASTLEGYIKVLNKELRYAFSNIRPITVIGGTVDYGLQTGMFDNSPIIQGIINNMVPGQRVVIDGGTYNCNSMLDFTNMPADSSFECYAVLQFPAGGNGIYVEGKDKRIFIKTLKGYSYTVTPNYSTYTGAAVKLDNAYQNTIEIDNIFGFKDAFWLHGGDSGGVCYNEIKWKTSRQCETAIRFTSSDNAASYVNSNFFYGGSIYGDKGLVTVKGAAQTDPYNDNSFHHVGFERINSVVCQLRFAKGNSFYSPRFEDGPGALPANGWIDEDTTCNYNQFHVAFPVYKNKTLNIQNGKGSEVHGTIYSDNGMKVAYAKLNDNNGVGIYYSERYSSELFSNTYYTSGGAWNYKS